MTEQDKRERIIAAAYTVLSEKGYDKASTKEIARTAGVAQGLINYYFPSKDLLFAEVFRQETERYCTTFEDGSSMPAEALQGPLTLDMIRAILKEPKERAFDNEDWYRLRYELIAIGLRDGPATETLREMLRMKCSYISRSIAELTGLPHEHADQLAAILFSIFEGLGLQKTVDPNFAYDECYEQVAQMLAAYMQMLSMKRDLS